MIIESKHLEKVQFPDYLKNNVIFKKIFVDYYI